MNLLNVRVDDRLIHGVVATTWIPQLNIERVIVIDQESAENQLMKSILRMATPKHVHLSVLTPTKAVANLKQNRYGEERLMIVMRSLDALYSLLDGEIPISKCILGNLGNIQRENGIAITKYITIHKETRAQIIQLYQRGIHFFAQLVPDDPQLDFIPMLNEKEE